MGPIETNFFLYLYSNLYSNLFKNNNVVEYTSIKLSRKCNYLIKLLVILANGSCRLGVGCRELILNKSE